MIMISFDFLNSKSVNLTLARPGTGFSTSERYTSCHDDKIYSKTGAIQQLSSVYLDHKPKVLFLSR